MWFVIVWNGGHFLCEKKKNIIKQLIEVEGILKIKLKSVCKDKALA